MPPDADYHASTWGHYRLPESLGFCPTAGHYLKRLNPAYGDYTVPQIKPKTNTKTLKENERKWTKQVMAAGWTAIPSVIFKYQQKLGLQPLDLNILFNIASYWWYAERKPYPSKAQLAAEIGVDPRTVQRRIAAMEKRGYIKREPRKHHLRGNDTNVYDLSGLIEAIKPYAQEMADEKDKKQAKAALRRGGRTPLKLTSHGDEAA